MTFAPTNKQLMKWALIFSICNCKIFLWTFCVSHRFFFIWCGKHRLFHHQLVFFILYIRLRIFWYFFSFLIRLFTQQQKILNYFLTLLIFKVLEVSATAVCTFFSIIAQHTVIVLRIGSYTSFISVCSCATKDTWIQKYYKQIMSISKDTLKLNWEANYHLRRHQMKLLLVVEVKSTNCL